MSLILSIETATKACSAALHEEGRLLARQELQIDKSHSSFLAPMIRELMDHAGKDMKALSAVAISKGPGSYTGLRIGTSTAKGICYALDIPLIAVNTLLAMAHQVNKTNYQKYRLCPMLDARRMEIYYLLTDANLEVIQATQSHVVDEHSFIEVLDQGPVIFFGNGMPKTKEKLAKHPGALFVEDIIPEAGSIGQMAWEKLKKGDFENTDSFEPFYLKDFIAGTPKKLL